MTALDSVRRTRTTVMVGVSAVVLVLAAVIGYAGVNALRRYEGATKVGNDALPIPATPVGMLATIDDQNVLGSLTLMVMLPDGAAGGSIVSVPVSADSTLGFGDVRIPFSEAYATEGAEGLRFAVESALSITLDVAMVATTAETAALLEPLGTVAVELPAALGDDFPAGVNQLGADQLVQVLNHRVDGQADRTRIPAAEAVWKAVAAGAGATTVPAGPTSVAAPPTTVVPDGGQAATSSTASPAPSSLAAILARLLQGPIGLRSLVTAPLDTESNPDGEDVEQLDRGDAILVFASIAPRSVSTPAAGLTYRIEAPPGYLAEVKRVIEVVVAYGGNVKSVYLDGVVQPETVFLVLDGRIEEQAKASKTDTAFKSVRFDIPDRAYEDIDVVLQLGTEFLTAAAADLATTTTATTTTTAAASTTTVAATTTTGG